MHGPELDGINCELNQLGRMTELDLSSFTVQNYSGLWDESEFPENEKETLIKKQIEDDKKWNDLSEFLLLIDKLINLFNTGKIIPNQLNHKTDWWIGYFNLPNGDTSDSFLQDLKTIKDFLIEAKDKGEKKTAFYMM